jgi:hypothetical protein
MKDIIILFTPMHTGTHFVRMLLESHPEIGVAIGEDYRINSAFATNYVLAGNGMGWLDPAIDANRDRSSERMLMEYFRDILRGEIDKKAFQVALEFWQMSRSENKLPLRNGEHHVIRNRAEFQELGIDLAPKQERYLLFRGHCHEYAGCDLSKLTSAFKVVVTVRHPLLSILTAMRRNPPLRHEGLIDSFIQGMSCIFSLPDAFVFCTDLWRGRLNMMESVFTYLDLPPAPASQKYLAMSPTVNNTVAIGEKHRLHNYCLEFEHEAGFMNSLRQASEMVLRGECPALLEPHWTTIKDAGLLPHYKRLGYTL